MTVHAFPSANFDDRCGTPVTMLVLHYTGMRSAQAALDRLADPLAKVSCHYLIDQDGTCTQMVEEAMRAWHAGKSFWRGITDVNASSIGIELVNPGHEFGYVAFPDAQMTALEELCASILTRHAVEPRNVVGHSDVAPLRKQDPGELFDWNRLASKGIGVAVPAWSDQTTSGSAASCQSPVQIAELQRKLAAWGYGLEATGELDDLTLACISAFQRHFRPRRVDGKADSDTVGVLDQLLAAHGHS